MYSTPIYTGSGDRLVIQIEPAENVGDHPPTLSYLTPTLHASHGPVSPLVNIHLTSEYANGGI